MQVFIPLIDGNPVKSYFPYPTKHIRAFLDKSVFESLLLYQTGDVTYITTELPLDIIDITEIKCTNSVPVSMFKHREFYSRVCANVTDAHFGTTKEFNVLVRPCYTYYCKMLLSEPCRYMPYWFDIFEKEMETNTDKEVLIPISLYESLVNQGFS